MFHFLKRAASLVGRADIGKIRLFVDSSDNLLKTKDSLGVVRAVSDGISSVSLHSTSGTNKTYRISTLSGQNFDFIVTESRGIASVVRTSGNGAAGTVDTYTVSYTDGTSSTFAITNGRDGLGAPATNNPTTIDPDDLSSIGTVTSRYALEDHQHAIQAAAPASNLTAATVNDEGVASSFSRSDHSHAISVGSPVALGASLSAGTSSSFARSDHVHINPVLAHEAAVDPHPQYTTASEAAASAPVQSFNGRVGSIIPQQSDYDAFFTTVAEASAAAPVQSVAGKTGAVTLLTSDVAEDTNLYFTAARASAAAPVQSVAGKTGTVTLLTSDVAEDTNLYFTAARASAAAPVQSVAGKTGAVTLLTSDVAEDTNLYFTAARASAAAPVQSVAGKTGAVSLVRADVGLANVVNPVVVGVRSTAAQTLNQTLTSAASVTIPANSLTAGTAFEIDVAFATLVNTDVASNLEVAVFVNGTQNSIVQAALGTTPVPSPGRGAISKFLVVFRAVGTTGSVISNGVTCVTNLANFASNTSATQTVNTTASVTLQVRVRSSAASTTGTVQIAAITQIT